MYGRINKSWDIADKWFHLGTYIRIIVTDHDKMFYYGTGVVGMLVWTLKDTRVEDDWNQQIENLMKQFCDDRVVLEQYPTFAFLHCSSSSQGLY